MKRIKLPIQKTLFLILLLQVLLADAQTDTLKSDTVINSTFQGGYYTEEYGHDYLLVHDIVISGNNRTKASVILREIPFAKHDSIPVSQLYNLIKLAEENILKTSLFHTADIVLQGHDRGIVFLVNVTERWYWWIWPLLENPDRNFNDWFGHQDITRLSAGLHFQHENSRGRMEKLNIKALAGYRTYLEGAYEWPYINRNKSLGLGFLANYSAQREINYATVDNRQLFYRSNTRMFESSGISLYTRLRPGLFHAHLFTLQYTRFHFSDTLQQLNREYLSGNSFMADLWGLSYMFRSDFRDNRAYPLRGVYQETELSALFNTRERYNQQSFRTSLRGYLPVAARVYAATELSVKFTTPVSKPYYLQNALGFDRNFVRGYEYQVIEGAHYALFKSHLRYAVLPGKVFRLPWIKTEKFNTIPISIFAGPHLDAGTVGPATDKAVNSLQGALLAGYGLGIDLVTYYDKVMRIEYTVRRQGGSGFFLHFMATI